MSIEIDESRDAMARPARAGSLGARADWNAANKQAYERIARIYAGPSPSEDDPAMRATYRDLLCERLPGPRVLELGCGPGTDAKALEDRGLEVLATDAADAFLEIVRERYPGLPVRRMDMARPDLPPASFDGIYAFGCFLHLPRALAIEALPRLRALLAPAGVLFLDLISSSKHAEYVIEEWGSVAENPVLFTCWEEAEIERHLRAAGFGAVEIFHTPSQVYEELPRLIERGVRRFQVIARA
jgi:SAM-dependent methyltransferase